MSQQNILKIQTDLEKFLFNNPIEYNDDKRIKEQLNDMMKEIMKKFNNEAEKYDKFNIVNDHLENIRSGLLVNQIGLNYLIINETENICYNELLYFTLRNLELGKKASKNFFKISKNSCEISLNPKEYIVLRFYRKHSNSSFSYNFKVKYQIKEISLDI